MTIVEFLHPVKKRPMRDICLAALYFQSRYKQEDSLTVEALRVLLKRAHVRNAARANIAAVLAQSAPFVDASGKDGNRFMWTLTGTGQQHVREMIDLPESDVEIEHDVSELDRLCGNITDPDTADYFREAIKCLSVGALRATVVFLWVGAVKQIRDQMIGCGPANVNAAIAKHDPRARTVRGVDDLAYVKESILLLAAQEPGLFDKNQRGVLEACLDLRNKCGHPGKYKVGPKKVSSFIEDLVNTVFRI